MWGGQGGWQGEGWGSYPFRKIRKLQEQYPYLSQIIYNFHLIFFPTMDIKNFTNVIWAGRGRVEFIFLTYFYIISSI